ncbi:MAG: TIGR03790 family protein [Bryobacterales bacterium]|nr:TIGR03790 family protein [Bryobacterales bacterium]
MRLAAALLVCAGSLLRADTGENVLLIVNTESRISREIGEYYQRRREIPKQNLCEIRAPAQETVSREIYEQFVERAVRNCLLPIPLEQRSKIHILATTKGVPLRIEPKRGGAQSDGAAVDSELTLLPRLMDHEEHPVDGPLQNPFFGRYREAFEVAKHRIFLVTRLTAFSLDDVRGMIDRCLEAENRGFFVFDLSRSNTGGGDQWMQAAARALPQNRVKVETTTTVLTGATGVIGYASWGSNDEPRQKTRLRDVELEWLPGGVATEFVSTDARTFEPPPEDWRPAPWAMKEAYWASSPQALTGDLIRQGASAATGHVYEPYLQGTPRPEYLFPAYYEGRTLAESFYLSIPYLSWMNVMAGDPLCSLGKP